MKTPTLLFDIYRAGRLVRTERIDSEIIKIGSLPTSHLRVEDPSVSGIHAVIEVVNGGAHLIDLGSATGTKVNGKKISKCELRDGDEIQFGNVKVVFRMEVVGVRNEAPSRGQTPFTLEGTTLAAQRGAEPGQRPPETGRTIAFADLASNLLRNAEKLKAMKAGSPSTLEGTTLGEMTLGARTTKGSQKQGPDLAKVPHVCEELPKAAATGTSTKRRTTRTHRERGSNRWKTVPVFISSTFKDMHAERDHLVKVVFPKIREDLEKYRIHIVDIDLRWGVTAEQSDNDKVLELCLDQIDKCRPIFMGILGDRYGWTLDELPDLPKDKFRWVQGKEGKSVTELEILHGVLRDPEEQLGLFYLRGEEFLADVSADICASVFVDEHKRELAAIKEKIRAHCQEKKRPLREYECRWDPDRPTPEDGTTGRIVALSQFGKWVKQDLWDTVAVLHPEILEDTPPLAPAGTEAWLDAELGLHERFIESRLRVHVERKKVHKKLTDYLESDSTEPLLLLGESGSGKSAILGHLWERRGNTHPNEFVIPHFVGASAPSTNIGQTLRRFCLEISSEFDLAYDVPNDLRKLPEAFADILSLVPVNERLVILIDGVNQLDEIGGGQDMMWLPRVVPPRVKVIVSCIDERHRRERAIEALRDRKIRDVRVGLLTDDERRRIVKEIPSISAKTLDKKQVAMLLENPATKNPLFLVVALEELRGFGGFGKRGEVLEDKIASFPQKKGEAGLNALFTQVIKRLEGAAEVGEDVVRPVLTLIASSRMGLSERELVAMFAPGEAGKNRSEEVEDGDPDLTGGMLVMMRQLRPYLLRRGELVDFYHRNLFKAVRERYLKTSQCRHQAHLQIADYFSSLSLDDRKLDELPWQLQHAEAWKRLKDCIGGLDVFERLSTDAKDQELLGYWTALGDRYDRVEVYNASLADIESTGLSDSTVAAHLMRVAEFLMVSGEYTGAKSLLLRAMKTTKGLVGPESLTTAKCYSLLTGLPGGSVMGGPERETFKKMALAIYEVELGPEHPDTLRCLNEVGGLLLQRGDFDGAEPLLRRALAIREKTLGPDHPDVAKSLVRFAALLGARGDHKGEETLHRRILEIQENSLGPEHRETAASLNNLGMMLKRKKDLDGAEKLVRRALETNEKTLGPDHPYTANCLNNLAVILHEKGDPDSTEALFRRALAINEKALGPEHRTTVTCLNSLAVVLNAKRDYDGAEPLIQRSLAAKEKSLGPEHPDLAIDLTNLAGLFVAKGNQKGAEPLLQRALAIKEKSLGPKHTSTVQTASFLAAVKMAGASPAGIRPANVNRPPSPEELLAAITGGMGSHRRGKKGPPGPGIPPLGDPRLQAMLMDAITKRTGRSPVARQPQRHPREASSEAAPTGLHKVLGEFYQELRVNPDARGAELKQDLDDAVADLRVRLSKVGANVGGREAFRIVQDMMKRKAFEQILAPPVRRGAPEEKAKTDAPPGRAEPPLSEEVEPAKKKPWWKRRK